MHIRTAQRTGLPGQQRPHGIQRTSQYTCRWASAAVVARMRSAARAAAPSAAAAAAAADAPQNGLKIPPPAIILVEPQMGENIGAAARAMKNFGLSELRLVAPKDGWPNPLAVTMSVGAFDLLDSAKLFPTVEEAVEDLTHLYAATARRRFMHKDYVMSRDLAAEVAGLGWPLTTPTQHPSGSNDSANGSSSSSSEQMPRVGFMFGRESSGLTNGEVAMAGKILVVDSDPSFAVLNLAQAVLVCCYELHPLIRGTTVSNTQNSSSSMDLDADSDSGLSSSDTGSDTSSSSRGVSNPRYRSGSPFRPELANDQDLASLGDAEGLLRHLFAELEAAGYFEVESRRASTESNIRNLLRRVPRLSKQEVASLHGMVSKLAGRRYSRQGSGSGSDGSNSS